MIRPRLLLMLFVAMFCWREVSAGALRAFPTRQQRLVIYVPTPPPEPIVKLPPPVAPGMDKKESISRRHDLPSDVEIEKNSPLTEIAKPAPAIEPDAETLQKLKIETERARLNHNAMLWQQERAAGGSATAMRSLAMRYLTGDAVEKDEVKGMDLLRKGAAGGDSAAIKELAKREPAKKE